jgi:hypothetical protein
MHPNDVVYIKPTDNGWREIVEYVDNFNDHVRMKHPTSHCRMSIPIADNEGYIKGQFWSLMQYFDWSAGMGSDIHFYDLRPKLQDQSAASAARLHPVVGPLSDTEK